MNSHVLLSPEVGDRALGAYLGLAVGDALGATVEFLTASEIAERYKIHNQIIGGGWLHLKAGCVTDDTEMSLVLGDALVRSGGWNLRAVADAFTAWLRRGPVDVGNTCRRGITNYIATGELSVPPDSAAAGNGAAMRNLPVALAFLGNEANLTKYSLEQAHLTHHHVLSDAAVTTLAHLTQRLILAGASAPCEAVINNLIARYPAFRFRPWPGRCGGYIVDTVQTVFDAFFNTGSFEDCVVRAVNRGGDADTTGALAGQLAGACYGVEEIPERWLKRLDPKITGAIYEQTFALLQLAAAQNGKEN